MSRCLRRRGRCVLVVQDSYFKDVHIDLAAIFVDMALPVSLGLRRQVDFPISRTFGSTMLETEELSKPTLRRLNRFCVLLRTHDGLRRSYFAPIILPFVFGLMKCLNALSRNICRLFIAYDSTEA